MHFNYSTVTPVLKKVPSFKERGALTNGESSLTIVEEEEEEEEGAHHSGPETQCQRRNKLPSPVPDMADFSLWTILRKNIGRLTSLAHSPTLTNPSSPPPSPTLPRSLLPHPLQLTPGKDLSRVSMPVTLNEPLSALQRLCEEVQYSELLDQAADLDDPCDRMVSQSLSLYLKLYKEDYPPISMWLYIST